MCCVKLSEVNGRESPFRFGEGPEDTVALSFVGDGSKSSDFVAAFILVEIHFARSSYSRLSL